MGLKMENFYQIAHSINVTPLVLAIKRRPEIWKADTFLRDYPQGPFGDCESIMLRFPPITVVQMESEILDALSKVDQHENVDREEYKILHEARPLIMALMTAVEGERLGRCIINKIKPGGRIYPHEDTPAHAEYYSRFHIVLQSEPGVVFIAGDEQVYMPTGTVWWFNNKLNHEVINNSAAERWHLVVDIRTSR